jgi:type I restriction enzyme S subunit
MSSRESVQLGNVATIVRKSIAPERISDGTTYVGLENIERGGALLHVTSVSRGDLASAKFAFTADQVLFGKLRPYLAKVARPAFSGVCSTDILPITPGPRLDKDYLAHYLLTPDVVALAASRASGANLPRLSPGELAKFEIPLPSLDEQRRIAAILDHGDALRAKRREALAHLDDLTQSIFLDMFGDRRDWAVTALKDLVATGDRINYGVVQPGDEVEGGFR